MVKFAEGFNLSVFVDGFALPEHMAAIVDFSATVFTHAVSVANACQLVLVPESPSCNVAINLFSLWDPSGE